MALFDFSEATVVDEVRQLEIVNPRNDEVVAVFDVVNIDSDRPSAIRRRYEKALLKNRRPNKDIDLEDIERQALDILAACVVGWKDVVWQGQPLPCTPENVKKLLGMKWVRTQVERFVSEPGHFLPDSSSVSETPATDSSSSISEPPTDEQ